MIFPALHRLAKHLQIC